MEAALKSFHKALDIYEKLVAENPTVIEYQSNLALIQNNIGNKHRTRGDLEAALKSHQQALEIREKLVAANPTVSHQKNLAASHLRRPILTDWDEPHLSQCICLRIARLQPALSPPSRIISRSPPLSRLGAHEKRNEP